MDFRLPRKSDLSFLSLSNLRKKYDNALHVINAKSEAWLKELQIKIHVSLITWSLDAYLLSLLTFLRTGLTLK